MGENALVRLRARELSFYVTPGGDYPLELISLLQLRSVRLAVSLSFKDSAMNPWIIADSFGEENVLTWKVVKVSHRIQKMRYIHPFVVLAENPSGTARRTRSSMESIARGRRWVGLHWPLGTTWFPYTSPAEISRACGRACARLPHLEQLPPLGIC